MARGAISDQYVTPNKQIETVSVCIMSSIVITSLGIYVKCFNYA